jgi:hypothetical protein
MEGSYLSTGPGPHGQAVGLFKCLRKTQFADRVLVRFEPEDGSGYLVRIMSVEDAEYYTTDTVYLISATTP